MKEEEIEPSLSEILFSGIDSPGESSRVSGLYGEVTDDNCRVLVSSLYYFRDSGKTTEEKPTEEDSKEEPETVETFAPMDLLISTEGGSVQDMFAVYDCMRDIKKDCDIRTLVFFHVGISPLIIAAFSAGAKYDS